jgi:hypothetical protein
LQATIRLMDIGEEFSGENSVKYVRDILCYKD